MPYIPARLQQLMNSLLGFCFPARRFHSPTRRGVCSLLQKLGGSLLGTPTLIKTLIKTLTKNTHQKTTKNIITTTFLFLPFQIIFTLALKF